MKFRTKERTNERKKKPGKILSSCSEFVEMNKWREREKKCRMQTKRIDGEQHNKDKIMFDNTTNAVALRTTPPSFA